MVRLLPNHEAAELLGISPTTLRTWKYRIGFFRIGSRIFHRESDIMSFLQSKYVPPYHDELQEMRERLIFLLKKLAGCKK